MNEAASFIERWKNAQKGLLKEGVDCSYLYVHLEADTNEPFYVGMGETFNRPWQRDRSKKHKNRASRRGTVYSLLMGWYSSNVMHQKYWGA